MCSGASQYADVPRAARKYTQCPSSRPRLLCPHHHRHLHLHAPPVLLFYAFTSSRSPLPQNIHAHSAGCTATPPTPPLRTRRASTKHWRRWGTWGAWAGRGGEGINETLARVTLAHLGRQGARGRQVLRDRSTPPGRCRRIPPPPQHCYRPTTHEHIPPHMTIVFPAPFAPTCSTPVLHTYLMHPTPFTILRRPPPRHVRTSSLS